MNKLAAAGSMAAVVLAVTACGGPAPIGPAYVAPTTAAQNPAIESQDGVTTPDQALGNACGQLPQGSANGSAASMRSLPAGAAIASTPVLSTFSDLADKAGLTDTLNHNKEMTIFAPSNDAWSALQQRMGTDKYNELINNTGELDRLMQYDIVVHRYSALGLVNQGNITTLQGATLGIHGSGTTMSISDNTKQTSNLLCGNLPTANATVFILDMVMLPDYPGVGDLPGKNMQ
jgi:uncharacterized surface protein with fasciclin (FAS1) repeats